MLKVSRQQQQKLPDCLSRENRLGKPGFDRSNFGGISGRKNTGDFPKPFHLSWQNSKWEKISICECDFFLPFDMEFFWQCLSLTYLCKKNINIPRGFQMAKTFPCQMANFFQIWKWIFFAISTFAIIDEMDTSRQCLQCIIHAKLASQNHLFQRNWDQYEVDWNPRSNDIKLPEIQILM